MSDVEYRGIKRFPGCLIGSDGDVLGPKAAEPPPTAKTVDVDDDGFLTLTETDADGNGDPVRIGPALDDYCLNDPRLRSLFGEAADLVAAYRAAFEESVEDDAEYLREQRHEHEESRHEQ